MKHLDDDFKLLRNAKTKVGSKRYAELIPLGEEFHLGSWDNLGNPSGSYNGLSSAVHEGKLYVGLETSGHIFRFDGPNTWTDMGQPSGATSINALKSYNHKLYANGDNGEVYRFDGIGNWTYVGNAGTCMVYRFEVYLNNLYAGTCGSGRVYRFDKIDTWISLGTTSAEAIRSSTIYEDKLYVGADDGHVYEYGGAEIWASKEETPKGAGIRSLVVFKNEMYCGVSGGAGAGHVFRYYGDMTWEDCGRLGTSTNVPTLVSFGGRLYGGADDGKVYRYDGHTTWTEIVHLGSGTSVNSFTNFEGKLCAAASTPSGNVYRVENQPGTVLDISSYVSKIGKVTSRLERKLNQFQPKTVSVDLMDDEFFFKSDKTGILDYDKIRQGYQLKVHVGLTGSNQWILMFDGKVNPDSAKSIDRETGVFTATGWLDDAKNYNAELIADPAYPPFENINKDDTCVLYRSAGSGAQLGAKKLEFGIESDNKWLSFDDGGKVFITETGDYWLWDAVKETCIKLNVNYSLLPNESRKDSFTLIEYNYEIIACGWWRNLKLGGTWGIVSKVMDEMGIIDKDIRVEELESLIGGEKNFIYMGPSLLPKGDVTATKIVNIDTTNNHMIKMLVGITEESTNKCFVYLLTIAYNAHTYFVSKKIELSNAYRVMKFMKFANRWWVLIGRRAKAKPNAYAPYLYRASYLKNFDANFNEDYSFAFSVLGSSYQFIYALSGSVLESSASSIYFMGQYNYDSNGFSEWYVKLFRLQFAAGSLTHYFVKTLETNGGTYDSCFADEWATLLPESSQIYYYYGIRKNDATTNLDIMKYGLSYNNFIDVKLLTGISGYIENFTRTTYPQSSVRQGYFIYQETSIIDRAYWIGRTGILYEETNEERIKNLIYGNPDFAYYYDWWHLDADGYYYIKSMYAGTGGEMLEAEKLETIYSIGNTAPDIFYDDFTTGKWYVGVVVKQGSKIITPFLYKTGVPRITIADLTGMTCERALEKLAEAYCCVFDIYEHNKARFYFREEYNAEDTIDYDDYLRPQKRDYWKNWCDGVIVENRKKGIRYRAGSPKGKIMKIDNPFISFEGQAKEVAQWLLTFFGKRRLLFSIDQPFYVEPELLDKIVLFLKDKDGNAWRSYNTMVYETSFNVSPGDKKSHNMELKLLEIGGEVVHVKNVMPIDSNKIVTET